MSDIARVIFQCPNCKAEMTICTLWLDGTARLTFICTCEVCGHDEVIRKSHRDLNREHWAIQHLNYSIPKD